LPTLNVALTGATGVSVSGSAVSGAVNVVSTFSGKLPRGTNGPAFGLVHLKPGVTVQQAFAGVGGQHGDLNGLNPNATLSVSGGAPGTLQTVLTPGNWVALNLSGNGKPAFQPFTVTQSASPAALPPANATESAVEFTFHGPTVVHTGTILRGVNDGWLVHMDDFIGVRSAADGKAMMALLRAGKDNKAFKLATNAFFSAQGPVSHGAVQQAVLTAKPGYYVEACFMDTQDHREHTQLGMERLIRVVK
jgi:hypothetical protein